jgi:hypothetical protein
MESGMKDSTAVQLVEKGTFGEKYLLLQRPEGPLYSGVNVIVQF